MERQRRKVSKITENNANDRVNNISLPKDATREEMAPADNEADCEADHSLIANEFNKSFHIFFIINACIIALLGAFCHLSTGDYLQVNDCSLILITSEVEGFNNKFLINKCHE